MTKCEDLETCKKRRQKKSTKKEKQRKKGHGQGKFMTLGGLHGEEEEEKRTNRRKKRETEKSVSGEIKKKLTQLQEQGRKEQRKQEERNEMGRAFKMKV